MAKPKHNYKKPTRYVKKRTNKIKVTTALRSRREVIAFLIFIAIFAIIGTTVYLFSSAAPGTIGFLNGQTSAAGRWCMHDDNTSPTQPDRMDVAKCDGLATQAWFFTGFTIRDTAMSGTRCLQPESGRTDINTIIVAARCNGSKIQEWRRDGKSHRFVNQAAPKFCLALPHNDVNYRLGLRPCSARYADQNWTTTSTASIYQNPMRNAKWFTRWRIDQGVDYHGSGHIMFLGKAVIVQEVPPVSAGWDGGWFIVYKLREGDDAGKYVYVAEDCTPVHTVSKKVYGPNDTVCKMFPGRTGVETGWAERPPDRDFAMAHSTYSHEGLATNYGKNFSSLMDTLGAPNATGDISRSSGSSSAPLPSAWPKW